MGLGIALGWLSSHVAEALLVRAFGSDEARQRYADCLADSECAERATSFIPMSGPGKVTFVLVVAVFIALGLWSKKRYLAKVSNASGRK